MAGCLGKVLREGAAGRSELGAAGAQRNRGGLEGGWMGSGCGAKAGGEAKAMHKKAVYGLASELGRNLIPF